MAAIHAAGPALECALEGGGAPLAAGAADVNGGPLGAGAGVGRAACHGARRAVLAAVGGEQQARDAQAGGKAAAAEGSPRCCVATRNANGDAIQAFLLAAGVAMPVNCVNAQQRTKADVALEQLAAAPRDGVVVLVDDDLRELVMDERLASSPCAHRRLGRRSCRASSRCR